MSDPSLSSVLGETASQLSLLQEGIAKLEETPHWEQVIRDDGAEWEALSQELQSISQRFRSAHEKLVQFLGALEQDDQ